MRQIDKKDKHKADKIRIAILFSGNGSNLENIVTHFTHFDKNDCKNDLNDLRAHIDFVLAICNKNDAYGITLLREAKIDLVILAGFMRILGSDFVREFRVINIHPSFLPLHKGANAINDSYYASEDFGGVSVHWVSEELDSGQIIIQQKLPKIKGESLESFESRIHALEYALYPQAIAQAIKSIFANKG